MRFKLISSYVLLILAPRPASTTNVYLFSPAWSYDGEYGGYNFIPDASINSHVTGVELGLTNTGEIYTGNILGDGVTRNPYPDGGCSLSGTKETLSIPAGARVTKVEAWEGASNSW